MCIVILKDTFVLFIHNVYKRNRIIDMPLSILEILICGIKIKLKELTINEMVRNKYRLKKWFFRT